MIRFCLYNSLSAFLYFKEKRTSETLDYCCTEFYCNPRELLLLATAPVQNRKICTRQLHVEQESKAMLYIEDFWQPADI